MQQWLTKMSNMETRPFVFLHSNLSGASNHVKPDPKYDLLVKLYTLVEFGVELHAVNASLISEREVCFSHIEHYARPGLRPATTAFLFRKALWNTELVGHGSEVNCLFFGLNMIRSHLFDSFISLFYIAVVHITCIQM